jgi:Rad51
MSQSTNLPTSAFQTYFSEMKCALDLLDQQNTIQKMSSGCAEIDGLIDGLQESLFYLFYSTHDNQIILDSLLNRILVGCILPKSGKKHGFESVAVFFNNVDYATDKNKHQILNPEKIAVISKYAGIEPKVVSKNLYIQTAYNLEHQITVAEEIADLIQSNPDIKLLGIRNLTKFFVNGNEDNGALKKVLNILYQVCTKNKVAIVATGHCNVSNSGIIPNPNGGTYLKHLVNVIVNLKPSANTNYYATSSSNSGSGSVVCKATMIKHPYQITPKYASFYAKRIGKRVNPMLLIFD